MRVGILSDVGITSRNEIDRVVDEIIHANQSCDLLIIAGNFAERQHVALGLLKLSFEKPVIYVPGTLELSGSKLDINEWLTDIQSRKFHTRYTATVLFNSADYQEMTSFLGTALLINPKNIAPGYRYKYPYNDNAWTAMVERIHEDSVEFLRDSIRPSSVVISYTPPLKDILPLNILGTDLTTLLSADVSFDTSPRLWICGAPDSVDVDIGGTRYVANPCHSRISSKIIVV